MDLPLDKSAYLICGEDEFRVSLAVKELIDALVPENERDFGLDRIDGRVDTVDATVNMIRSVRDALVSDGLFCAGSKTVWLRDPSFLTNDRVAKSEAVKTALADITDSIKSGLGDGQRLIVSTVKINRSSAFFKAFSGKRCEVKDFGSGLKPRQKNEAAAMLIAEFIPKLGITMEQNVRQVFLARVGTDSRQIVSELEKLACYCGNGKAASIDDVREIVSSGAVSEIWDFVDAFATRNAKALIKQVKIQLEQGENAIRLVNSLLSTACDLLVIREGFEKHWASPEAMKLNWDSLPEDIADGLQREEKGVFSMTGFPLKKKIDQSSAWTVRDLRNARHYLIELREQLVSCGLSEEFLMETKLLQAIGIKRTK